ncbi:hypothetical protein RhiJN_08214 [Ceratobasidium sp. AG-Ba]|nr:hypothetical protein RhiJN_08214 [Ceratobasidium sp. AG-Ba]QRW08997.1 hypothetical protein RhiLY_07996 [Ceratobasidium sp. AG-Ba]
MPPARRATAAVEAVAEKPEDKLAINGRQLTRLVDMFWCANEVLALAKRLHGMSSQAELNLRNTANDNTKRLFVLIDALNGLDPELMAKLTECGAGTAPIVMRDTRKQLSGGQTNAKAEDMRKVKQYIGNWWDWSEPMPDMDHKHLRGLNHEGCAYMLSEPSLDWSDLEKRTQFMKYGNPAMDPSAWPRYLRSDGEYDSTRSSVGLLKGPLLVKAARAILLSPSAANTRLDVPGAATAHTGTRGKRRRGIIGIAKSYQIAEVTTAFIAYVAVVVRHALTSDETFSENCGGFDYVEYYTQLREFLDAPRFKRRSALLLAWWNEQVFGDCRLTGVAASTSRRHDGTLAELDAELEEDEEMATAGGEGDNEA